MTKFKLMISSLFLALALIFASASNAPVYANVDDPQGGSKSISAPAPPPPDPTMYDWLYALLTMARFF